MREYLRRWLGRGGALFLPSFFLSFSPFSSVSPSFCTEEGEGGALDARAVGRVVVGLRREKREEKKEEKYLVGFMKVEGEVVVGEGEGGGEGGVEEEGEGDEEGVISGGVGRERFMAGEGESFFVLVDLLLSENWNSCVGSGSGRFLSSSITVKCSFHWLGLFAASAAATCKTNVELFLCSTSNIPSREFVDLLLDLSISCFTARSPGNISPLAGSINKSDSWHTTGSCKYEYLNKDLAPGEKLTA
jgi:hypothetical protein